MKDFIIVGHGLSAHVLANYLHNNNLSFLMIGDSGLSNCSRVAAGIWNPVVFKRMTKSWMADELISELHKFYGSCEKRFGKSFLTKRPIVKPFSEEQEKVLWKKKATAELSPFIDESIFNEIPEELRNLKIPDGYGQINESGNIQVCDFLDASSSFHNSNIRNEVFEYDKLSISPNQLSYKGLKSKSIIFCEGYLVKDNPYFSWIPLKPAKGEVLTITNDNLRLNKTIFNKNGFIFKQAEGEFKIGATYAWDDLEEDPTEKGLNELKDKLGNMTNTKYSILKHETGIRPSSLDRRPIIGKHPTYPSLFVFNGLGTKGVMLAPYFAEKFVLFFLQKGMLPDEVDVKRFYNLYREE